MRRKFLETILGMLTTIAVNPVWSKSRTTKSDSRIIGSWRSNKEKTLSNWKFPNDLSPDKRERVENISGKFTVRFTTTHVHTEFDGTKDTVAYTIIGSDKNSVVIARQELEGTSIQQIHFEDGGYYVLTGYNLEFFNRIEN